MKAGISFVLKKLLPLVALSFLMGCGAGLGSEELLTSSPLLLQGEDISGTSDPSSKTEDKETTPVTESTPAPTPVPTPMVVRVTVSAAGDCSLGNYLTQNYVNSFDQTYTNVEPEYFFQNVREIFENDDLTLVNLEGVLTERTAALEPGKDFNIKGLPEYIDILTLGSVEAVSMGNNHTLDFAEGGREDTKEIVKNAGIVYAVDSDIGIFEVNGIRIGMVSVNSTRQAPESVSWIEKGLIKLREEECDLRIVSCHWGIEKDYVPNDYQRNLGRKCIDLGADLVIGHHPHVLQGIESYQGKLILYSLGNFCFGANRNPFDKDSMIFQQTFTFVDGDLQDGQDVKVIPCSVSSVKDRNNYQPTPLEAQEAERVILKINEISADFGVRLLGDGTLDQ